MMRDLQSIHIKPVKYHIKLFEVNDARTGYCLGFDVYTGKEYLTRCAQNV